MSNIRVKQPQPVLTTATVQDGFPSALMDDTVYTMDDSRVLMGGLTVPGGPQPFRQQHLNPRVR